MNDEQFKKLFRRLGWANYWLFLIWLTLMGISHGVARLHHGLVP